MRRDRELAFAGDVVGICRKTLPPLDAAIVHGSLVLGDFVPGRSDIDLLAIVAERPSDDHLEALVAAMTDQQERAVGTVDLRVVRREVAAAPTPSPPMEAYIGLEPRGESLEIETRHPERDLVVEFSVCRAYGRSLAGPPPAEVIGDVPDEWVSEVGAEVLATWQRQEFDPAMAAFMVFTACRIRRFAREHVHCSKPEAARWALRQDPSLAIVQAALDGKSIDEHCIRDFLTYTQNATQSEPPRSPGFAEA